MAGLTSEQRFELLQTLRTDSGQAEMGGRIEDNFYPIAEHFKVSDAYVTQAFDEFKWLPRVKECLKSTDQVPWESRQKLEIAFRQHWSDWENADVEVRPPTTRPKELVDLLLELGIVRNRTGEKFDVPDLYLKGLGLKRKGGVARRARSST